MDTGLAQLGDSFARALRAEMKAPRTVTLYCQSVRIFSQWLIDNGQSATLDRLTSETAFLRATGQHPTGYATGIADLTAGRPARLLDVVDGRSGPVLAGWLAERDPGWRARVVTASLDPFRGYASALSAQLPDAVRVLDPFHVVKLSLTCLDQIRRRVQQEQSGHRGLRDDPLFGIRRVLRRRRDRLSVQAASRLRAGLMPATRTASSPWPGASPRT